MEEALEKINRTLMAMREDMDSGKRDTAALQLRMEEMHSSMLKMKMEGAAKPAEPAVPSGSAMPRLFKEPVKAKLVRPDEGQGLNLKLQLPERFMGNPKTFRPFMAQCTLHFKAKLQQLGEDAAKILFIISNLGGDALAWASPYLEQDSPILLDYNIFLGEFKRVFEPRLEGHTRKLELLTLRQGSMDVTHYIAKFNQLVVELAWPEEAQFSVFYLGLREELKDSLQLIFPFPTEIRELMDLVIQMEQRKMERKGEVRKTEFRRTSNGGGVRPIEKGSSETSSRPSSTMEPRRSQFMDSKLRGPLAPEEKERRTRMGLCMYCGQKGHLIRDCPLTRTPKVPEATVKLATQEELPTDKPENKKAQEETEGPPRA